ncbi:MAG: GNAT family N-acetyltransferase [Candidatus Shapirobacteria bacterium]
MNITIREYQENDKERIKLWIEQLHDYLVKLDPDYRLRRLPEYGQVFTDELFDFIEDGNGKIFIAMDDDLPIGFSAGAIDKQSNKNLLEVVPSTLGVISDVFVNENYRGQGIGKQLLNKLEDYLKSIGCDSLWLNVVSFNPAHQVYSKLGFHDREIGMFKKI